MAVLPGTTFGLCSKKANYDSLNGEKKALFDAALRHFESVVLIDPRDVLYFFERGAKAPRLMHHGADISGLSVLLIRSTSGREVSSAMLAHTLHFCGCNTVDPVERFSVGYASKLLTTITRFERGVGTNSWIAFGVKNATQLLWEIPMSTDQPLLFKPVAGKKGKGVAAFTHIDQALAFLDQIPVPPEGTEQPFLFQTLEHFTAEYRVMVMNGEVLGMVEKVKAEGAIAANAAQGGQFISVQVPEVASFVVKNVSHQGLLGVDVAIDTSGGLHLIEANRAPMWGAFQAATGVDVAEGVVERIVGSVSLNHSQLNQ